MSLLYRLKRRLGYDTTTEVSITHPIKDYTITHPNGETSEVRCHGYNVDGAVCRFYKYTDVYVWNLHGYSVSCAGQVVVRTLEGIQEIESVTLGKSEFWALVDRADGRVLETDVVNVPGGSNA